MKRSNPRFQVRKSCASAVLTACCVSNSDILGKKLNLQPSSNIPVCSIFRPLHLALSPLSTCCDFFAPSAWFQLYRFTMSQLVIIPTWRRRGRDKRATRGRVSRSMSCSLRRFLQDLYFTELYLYGFVFLG